MTPASSKQFVLGAVVITAGTAAVAAIADPKDGRVPPVRIAIGAAIVAFGLTALANAAPELAAMLAGLLVVATVLTHGSPLAATILRATNPRQTP